MTKISGKTVEARERQLVALAVNQAEKMLEEGKAPPAVLMHYLRLGASDYPLRKERIERQNELFKAKTEALERQDNLEEITKNAIEAMRRYSGNYGDEDPYNEVV